jgi:hypothetical protein
MPSFFIASRFVNCFLHEKSLANGRINPMAWAALSKGAASSPSVAEKALRKSLHQERLWPFMISQISRSANCAGHLVLDSEMLPIAAETSSRATRQMGVSLS